MVRTRPDARVLLIMLSVLSHIMNVCGFSGEAVWHFKGLRPGPPLLSMLFWPAWLQMTPPHPQENLLCVRVFVLIYLHAFP